MPLVVVDNGSQNLSMDLFFARPGLMDRSPEKRNATGWRNKARSPRTWNRLRV
jgi:hypothetical protein